MTLIMFSMPTRSPRYTKPMLLIGKDAHLSRLLAACISAKIGPTIHDAQEP